MVRAYIDNLEENTKTASSRLQQMKNIENEKHYDVKIKLISKITEWQNKLTTLIGLLLALYFIVTIKKHNKVIFIFALYFSYIFFISGISSTQGDRFHIVFYPIVLLLLFIFLKNTKNITNKYIK